MHDFGAQPPFAQETDPGERQGTLTQGLCPPMGVHDLDYFYSLPRAHRDCVSLHMLLSQLSGLSMTSPHAFGLSNQ
jgi:hypothetical protein